MTTIAKDLEWLQAEAFEFTLSLNDHHSLFETVAQHDRSMQLTDWIDPAERSRAIADDQLVRAHLYSCCAESCHIIAGASLGAVIRHARERCERELERWHAAGRTPHQHRRVWKQA